MRKVSHLMVLVCFMLLLFPSCKKSSGDYVQTVKQGVLDFDKSLTVGDAYDNYKYFVQKEWTSFETEQKRIVVQFKGQLNLDSLKDNTFTDEDVNILKESIKNLIHITQFAILKGDKDVNRFEVKYCGFLINYKNGNEKEFPEPDLKFISSIYQNEMSWEQYKTRWVLSEIIVEFNEEKEKKRSAALKLEAIENMELLWKQCFTNCGESFYGIFEKNGKEIIFEGKGKGSATLGSISLNSVDSKVACVGYTKFCFEALRFWKEVDHTWSDWQSKESVKDEVDALCLRSKILKEDGVWKLDFSDSYKIKVIDCENIPVNQGAPVNKAKEEDFLKENARMPGIQTTASGLQYLVISTGTGPLPKITDTIKVHYRGTLLDGTEFDSSYKRNAPAVFPLNGVIKGWVEALQMMKVGSKWQIFLPSSLAYGERGAGQVIGPNATLIFDVELLSIEKTAVTVPK